MISDLIEGFLHHANFEKKKVNLGFSHSFCSSSSAEVVKWNKKGCPFLFNLTASALLLLVLQALTLKEPASFVEY